VSFTRPRFALGAANALTMPMATVAGLSLAEVTISTDRQVSSTPLLHQEVTALNDATPAVQTRIEMRLGLSTASQPAALTALQLLRSTIGTSKKHLWLIDDDQVNVLYTLNNEAAGAGVVVEYGTPPKAWFALGDYMLVTASGGGSVNEVVVVTSKNDGTPSFTATLSTLHDAGASAYRVGIVYPNSVLTGIRPSALPLGKGSVVLSWLSGSVPLHGTNLPS
jgi:hypothetical protein